MKYRIEALFNVKIENIVFALTYFIITNHIVQQ